MKLKRGPAVRVLTIVRPVLVQPHHPSGPGRKRRHARGASRSLPPPGWAYRGVSAQAEPFGLRDRFLLPEKAGLGRRLANHGISGLSHWPHRIIPGCLLLFLRRAEVESLRGRARKWLRHFSIFSMLFTCAFLSFLLISISFISLTCISKAAQCVAFILFMTSEPFVCGP